MAVTADKVVVEIEAYLDKNKNIERAAKDFGDGMNKIERDAKKAEGAVKGAGAGMSRGLSAVGIGAGIAAAAMAAFLISVNQVKNALAAGDELQTSADKLRISAERLQELGFAADESDVPLSALQSNLEGLNSKLGAFKTNLGDDAVEKAFKALKISREDLAGINDANQLLPLLADRLSDVSTTAAQVKIAKSLGVEELLPLLRRGSEGIAELSDEAHRLGLVISNETVKALADADRQMEIASKTIDANLTVAFSGLAVGVANVTSALADFITKWGQIERNGPRWAQVMLDLVASGGNAQAYAYRQGARQQAGRKSNPIASTFPSFAEVKGMIPGTNPGFVPDEPKKGRAGPKDRSAEIAAQQRDRLNAALTAAAQQELAARLSMSKTAEERAALELQRIEADRRGRDVDLKLAVEKKELTVKQAAQVRKAEAQSRALEIEAVQTRERQEVEARLLAQAQIIGGQYDEINSIVAAQAKTIRERYELEKRALAARQRQEREALEAEIERDGLTPFAADARRNALGDLQKAQGDDLFLKARDELAEGISEALVAARGGVDSFADYFKQKLAAALLESLSTDLAAALLGGAGGGIGKAFAGLFGRASGGHVVAGRPYLVGENGPEPFVPAQSGRIISNGALAAGGRGGGASTVNLNMTIDLKGANGDATIARIASQAAAAGAQQAHKQALKDMPAALDQYQRLRR